MDISFSLTKAATQLPQSVIAASYSIPAESPLRIAPVIREVIRAAANSLMFEARLLCKKVESTAPCFAIRTREFNELHLMRDALPREVWNLVAGTFTPEDLQMLFSTCKVMKACLEKYIDKAEQQYAETADQITAIANDLSSNDDRVRKNLKKFFNRHDYVNVPLSKCTRMRTVLNALGQNKSIKLLRIEARNTGGHASGMEIGASFRNLHNARIELDVANNNFWKDGDFSLLFQAAAASAPVSRLNLDKNNFWDMDRSRLFFNFLFSIHSRIDNLSLAGSDLIGGLSDFGMSVLAYGLMLNQPHRLKTINLRSTSTKRGPLSYPEEFSPLHFPLNNDKLNLLDFDKFSRTALKTDKKSGFQLVIEALKTNKTITSINLSACEIGDKMAKIIAGSLEENITLQELHLGLNFIKFEGIKALAKAIRQHPSLEFLDLTSNIKIEEKGWVYFFTALSDNTRLRHLYLGSCGITDKGILALAAMLKTNRTLKKLSLSNSWISDEGMMSLARSLSGHPSICFLDLEGCHLNLKQVAVLKPLVEGGMQVRGMTDIQYGAEAEWHFSKH